MDSQHEPSRSAAAVAVASVVERLGMPVRWPESKGGGKLAGVFEVGGDGVVVTVAGDDRTADWGGVGRQYRWRRMHLLHMAERALSIRTVTI